jgi:tetratricopeptide (TPR) repeat protein
MLQFNEVVKEYNTSGLRFGYKYYPDDDHGSVPLITEYEALRFIFDGYRVNLGRALANPSYLADHYKAVSENLGVPFQPSEAMISQLAGFAVGQDTAKAIQFYELAAQMYPRSFRSFDRLGVLYAAKGEKSKAIDNLQKSLALNPNNGLTANKLKQLQGQ